MISLLVYFFYSSLLLACNADIEKHRILFKANKTKTKQDIEVHGDFDTDIPTIRIITDNENVSTFVSSMISESRQMIVENKKIDIIQPQDTQPEMTGGNRQIFDSDSSTTLEIIGVGFIKRSKASAIVIDYQGDEGKQQEKLEYVVNIVYKSNNGSSSAWEQGRPPRFHWRRDQ